MSELIKDDIEILDSVDEINEEPNIDYMWTFIKQGSSSKNMKHIVAATNTTYFKDVNTNDRRQAIDFSSTSESYKINLRFENDTDLENSHICYLDAYWSSSAPFSWGSTLRGYGYAKIWDSQQIQCTSGQHFYTQFFSDSTSDTRHWRAFYSSDKMTGTFNSPATETDLRLTVSRCAPVTLINKSEVENTFSCTLYDATINDAIAAGETAIRYYPIANYVDIGITNKGSSTIYAYTWTTSYDTGPKQVVEIPSGETKKISTLYSYDTSLEQGVRTYAHWPIAGHGFTFNDGTYFENLFNPNTVYVRYKNLDETWENQTVSGFTSDELYYLKGTQELLTDNYTNVGFESVPLNSSTYAANQWAVEKENHHLGQPFTSYGSTTWLTAGTEIMIPAKLLDGNYVFWNDSDPLGGIDYSDGTNTCNDVPIVQSCWHLTNKLPTNIKDDVEIKVGNWVCPWDETGYYIPTTNENQTITIHNTSTTKSVCLKYENGVTNDESFSLGPDESKTFEYTRDVTANEVLTVAMCVYITEGNENKNISHVTDTSFCTFKDVTLGTTAANNGYGDAPSGSTYGKHMTFDNIASIATTDTCAIYSKWNDDSISIWQQTLRDNNYNYIWNGSPLDCSSGGKYYSQVVSNGDIYNWRLFGASDNFTCLYDDTQECLTTTVARCNTVKFKNLTQYMKVIYFTCMSKTITMTIESGETLTRYYPVGVQCQIQVYNNASEAMYLNHWYDSIQFPYNPQRMAGQASYDVFNGTETKIGDTLNVTLYRYEPIAGHGFGFDETSVYTNNLFYLDNPGIRYRNTTNSYWAESYVTGKCSAFGQTFFPYGSWETCSCPEINKYGFRAPFKTNEDGWNAVIASHNIGQPFTLYTDKSWMTDNEPIVVPGSCSDYKVIFFNGDMPMPGIDYDDGTVNTCFDAKIVQSCWHATNNLGSLYSQFIEMKINNWVCPYNSDGYYIPVTNYYQTVTITNNDDKAIVKLLYAGTEFTLNPSESKEFYSIRTISSNEILTVVSSSNETLVYIKSPTDITAQTAFEGCSSYSLSNRYCNTKLYKTGNIVDGYVQFASYDYTNYSQGIFCVSTDGINYADFRTEFLSKNYHQLYAYEDFTTSDIDAFPIYKDSDYYFQILTTSYMDSDVASPENFKTQRSKTTEGYPVFFPCYNFILQKQGYTDKVKVLYTIDGVETDFSLHSPYHNPIYTAGSSSSHTIIMTLRTASGFKTDVYYLDGTMQHSGATGDIRLYMSEPAVSGYTMGRILKTYPINTAHCCVDGTWHDCFCNVFVDGEWHVAKPYVYKDGAWHEVSS